MTKPDYRVPSMEEIRDVPWNGLTVASTFSGCGGSCLGFEMAGYRVGFASEFVPAAAETYSLNHQGVPVSTKDVRELTGQEILDAVGGPIDVLEGSPPCASFSTAGKRAAHWGDVKKYSDTSQRTDDLFFEYARLLTELQPRAFVAENVAGLTVGVAKGYFKMIFAALADCGYRVEARMLDAQWLGVPQVRRRVIFVGMRNDLGLDPVFPDPLPYRYSIREAIPWITKVTSASSHGPNSWDTETLSEAKPAWTVPTTPGGASFFRHEVLVEVGAGGTYGTEKWRGIDVPVGTIGASPQTGNGRSPSGIIRTKKIGPHETVADDVAPTIEGYAIGDEWDGLGPGEKSDRFFSLVRPDADKPIATVTAAGGSAGAGAPGGVASVTHPTEKRKFTIGELRRLCGFPDDFQLTGSYAQQWERLGRAVPPPMMRAVAETLSEALLSAG